VKGLKIEDGVLPPDFGNMSAFAQNEIMQALGDTSSAVVHTFGNFVDKNESSLSNVGFVAVEVCGESRKFHESTKQVSACGAYPAPPCFYHPCSRST
jgi:hypothetical protein